MQDFKTEGVLPEMLMEESVRMFLNIDYGYFENLIPAVAVSVATQTLYENILAVVRDEPDLAEEAALSQKLDELSGGTTWRKLVDSRILKKQVFLVLSVILR